MNFYVVVHGLVLPDCLGITPSSRPYRGMASFEIHENALPSW